MAALLARLAALEARPDELALDEGALELRTYARLNLARAYQIAGQPERAVEVMDEALTHETKKRRK